MVVVSRCREKQGLEQSHYVWLLAAPMLPREDDGFVIAKEAYSASRPVAAGGAAKQGGTMSLESTQRN